MGLSAWKQYGHSRWALRVNPSSGNLHPTEAYVVHDGRTFHYAPREHALEERCVFDREEWRRVMGTPDGAFLVALTSIHWREAWKYGERAFRYCQHDVGHALGALRLAGAMLGWHVTLLTDWSDRDLGRLLGVDRDEDFSACRAGRARLHCDRECRPLFGQVEPGPVSAPVGGSSRFLARRGKPPECRSGGVARHRRGGGGDEVSGTRTVRRCDGARCEVPVRGATVRSAPRCHRLHPSPPSHRRTIAPSHLA